MQGARLRRSRKALESFAQRLHVIVGNLRHSRISNRIGGMMFLELHGLEALGQHLPLLEPIARLGLDLLGVSAPMAC